ncbi:Mcm10p [Sugiyamaella lignohabitans]|uniref:Mcm10p n=1 Tax=Sugiyamaella lignohabitans TaxID=796027 RepID=A0A167EJP9_9ASCO|nr:Mcm10p [Sugiyamaella lignohabitans]ANB14158.1 Mcm10p [Sugiyamaella lignohabitans]
MSDDEGKYNDLPVNELRQLIRTSSLTIVGDIERQLAQLKAKERELKDRLKQKKSVPSTSQQNIEIPTTPPKNRQRVPVSPARIRLKIDKGLQAKDVSLRRSPKRTNYNITGTDRAERSSFADQLLNSSAALREKEAIKLDLERKRVTKFSLKSNIGQNDGKAGGNSVTETYSKLRLSHQFIAKEELDSQFEDKKIMSVGDVYAIIHPPHFEPPAVPNFVVIGIVAKRSEVKVNKLGKKYMMMTLTDLNYDIPLALHSEAFDMFWKIREGTVIAVLNPEHYIISRGVSEKSIGLSVTSSLDVILELGRSSDLGQCPSITQNGKKCTQWINLSKSKYCEFHLELGVRRAASSRMEFNSVQGRMFSPKKNGRRLQFMKGGVASKTGLQEDPLAPRRDPLFGNEGRIFMTGAKSSAATFFQDEYDLAPTGTSEEAAKRLQKKLKDKEMESKIRKYLADRPDGHLLREYDVKGRLIEDDSTVSKSSSSKGDTIFSAQQIRRLGFDPTKRINVAESSKVSEISLMNAADVDLSRPKKRSRHESDDDSDDLEII